MAYRRHVAVLAVAMAAALGAPVFGQGDKPQTEMTGVVIDRETGKPIEGVFVMALYLEYSPGPVDATFCVKSKGVYTGKDGTFRFPIEKQDGRSPATVDAIHVDYKTLEVRHPPPLAAGKPSFQGLQVELEKQKPPNWVIRNGSPFSFCKDARSRKDAEASAQYFRIKLEQWTRMGAPGGIESTKYFIERLESLDGSESRAR